MRIILAQHFGLCFGVRDAIAQAYELAREAPLTILGELVHNPIVQEQLGAEGVRQGSLDDLRSESHRVLITAHGASDLQRKKWLNAGYDVADATCPLVRHAHEQLKRLVGKGYFPVIIGKRGHVEVRGLTEDFADSFVLQQVDDLAKLPLRSRYGVVAQTTQSIDHVHALVQAIRSFRPESKVMFVDTVCRPTKERQLALQQLLEQVEAVVVVGGHGSNNTRQLVERCRQSGKIAFHIERAEELLPEWFVGIKTLGLTAGTSTLPETVGAVHQRLLQFSARLR